VKLVGPRRRFSNFPDDDLRLRADFSADYDTALIFVLSQ
jgi:hypothetical protein